MQFGRHKKIGLDAEVDINNNCRKAFLAQVFQNFPELRENLHRKINRGFLSVVFYSGQKMALRALCSYQEVRFSQRHLLASFEIN